jgi:RNA polymerase sigma factor (TIGR02999 family)
MSEVTRLLQRMREGDRGALDDVMSLVYDELRRIARSFMRRQQPGHTLQPTALVNEAFIKLFQDAEPQLADRAHFLALMSRVMRQVLVDHARAHGAVKRGGGEAPVPGTPTSRCQRTVATNRSSCSTCTARSRPWRVRMPRSRRSSRCTISAA